MKPPYDWPDLEPRNWIEIARVHAAAKEANEMKQWRRDLKGWKVKALIWLAIGMLVPFGFLIQACAGAVDGWTYVPKPGRITVTVLPSAEEVHPGLTEAVKLNADRWCEARGLCGIDVRDGRPQPADWLVMGGGVSHGPSKLARTIYEQKRIVFFRSQPDGDLIRLMPTGECREHLPPHQTDAEMNEIVGHELGHALGLPRHSDDPNSIMREGLPCDDLRP